MVYIVVLNYNNAADTMECISSLLKSEYTNFKILLVDNHSTDGSLETISDFLNTLDSSDFIRFDDYKEITKSTDLKKINLIESRFNGGFSYGNNIGSKIAMNRSDFEYLWLLNNDTEIPTDTLTTLINYYKNSSEKLGILGNLQYFYHKKDEIQAIAGGFNRFIANYWNINSLDQLKSGFNYIYGASMFMSKDFVMDVGLLCEDYFMYYEEIDIAERAKNSGYQIDICKEAKIYHKHGNTTSKKGNKFRTFYLERNKFLFYKKYYPHLLLIPYLKILKLLLRSILKERDLTKVLIHALYYGGMKFEKKKNSHY